MGPSNPALDGGQDETNPFATTSGDKSATQPFNMDHCVVSAKHLSRVSFSAMTILFFNEQSISFFGGKNSPIRFRSQFSSRR